MSERLSSAEHSSQRLPAGRQGLADRRRLRRRRVVIAAIILFLILIGGCVYGFHRDSVRISHIQIYGADISQLADFSAYATNAMQGNYLGIIPRDSIFFFPASCIRANILAAHPDIAAVSIFRNGLTGLSIKIDERAPVARWCGAAPEVGTSTPSTNRDCYFFDVKGFVYATTTAIQPMNSFSVYEPVLKEGPIIGSLLPNANEFPSAFDFARQLGTLGSPVTQIVFRNDEVDDSLASGTRVTYVLGDEQNAFTALMSARENINLADGSIEYIDLRFDGKMYLKKK